MSVLPPPEPAMTRPLLLLGLLTCPSLAQAATTTGYLCLRNDGVGTFSYGDLDIFADSDWSAGDRTASAPGSGKTLAPGAGECYAITGLYVWNGYQYQYVFEVSFMDTTGTSTFYSGSGLKLTTTSTWYIGATGASTSKPSTANYISVSNDAPDGFTSMSAARPHAGA